MFKLLKEQSDGIQAKTVLKELESIVPPTPFENSSYPNNPTVRRYEKIVRFSTITSVKAGWLLKNKGTWSLTDEGAQAYSTFQYPEEFAKEANSLYRKWKKDQPTPDDSSTENGDDSVSTTLEEAEEAAWVEIEDYLTDINPYDFQDIVAGLLRGMGYHLSWISPPGPDKGIDIIGHIDPLGIKGPRIKVQVKRRGDKINVDGIRSFLALLSDGDVGLFISIGGFTRDSESEARGQEKRKIMLIDLKRFFDLWVEYYKNIPEAQRRLLPLKPVHYLDLPE